MKKLTTILFIILISYSSYSQSLTGKWYMINRSGLIELSITNDSIKNTQLFTDFKSKERPSEKNKIQKIERLNDKFLVIEKSKKDSTKFSAITIFEYKENVSFKISWNALDTIADDLETLIEFHKADKRDLFGYLVYSENSIPKLKKMKAIKHMTRSDFKVYMMAYLENIKATRKDFEKVNFGYSAASYNFQIITQTLYEIGYNPLQNIRTVDEIYQKYYQDPEIQKLIDKNKDE